tara:strand:+ start:29085 stop:29996 length:912 start_codon:yes stop_codon:yes gene_type:complete
MWQNLKVWLFRKYYRAVNALAWRGHTGEHAWVAVEIPGGDSGPLHARLYQQHTTPDKPVIVYFHGGGWVIGDLQTHSPFCEMLNRHTHCSVIAVNYRLAPEHPFPAAPQDCLHATQWIAQHVGDFGPSSHQLILAGDSAGAHLATVTCLAADVTLREKLLAQWLIYPAVVHYSADFASYREKAKARPLTTDIMMWFWDTWLAGLSPRSEQLAIAQPLLSSHLATLPATFVVTAEHDPLRDEGRAYAEKLKSAGVNLVYRHFEHAAHGFACSEGPTEDVRVLMSDVNSWIESLQAGDTGATTLL